MCVQLCVNSVCVSVSESSPGFARLFLTVGSVQTNHKEAEIIKKLDLFSSREGSAGTSPARRRAFCRFDPEAVGRMKEESEAEALFGR